jgi:WD40 repeat protein
MGYQFAHFFVPLSESDFDPSIAAWFNIAIPWLTFLFCLFVGVLIMQFYRRNLKKYQDVLVERSILPKEGTRRQLSNREQVSIDWPLAILGICWGAVMSFSSSAQGGAIALSGAGGLLASVLTTRGERRRIYEKAVVLVSNSGESGIPPSISIANLGLLPKIRLVALTLLLFTLLSSGVWMTVRISTAMGELMAIAPEIWNPVLSVAFSPDGTQVLTGSADSTARLWDATTGAELRTFTGHNGSVSSVAFSPDGGQVLTASGLDDNTARLWDATTGDELRVFAGHVGSVTSVAFSPDGAQVLTGSRDTSAILWDTHTGAEVRNFAGHTARLGTVAFSPDGGRVLTGSYWTVKLWDLSTGEELDTYDANTTGMLSVAFSPGGAWAMTHARDGAVTLLDALTGNELQTFVGHNSRVRAVAISPDGSRLLTGDGDGAVKLWDATTGDELKAFVGHTSRVCSVALSPDKSRVLTGAGDGTAKLWDATTGDELHTFASGEGSGS